MCPPTGRKKKGYQINKQLEKRAPIKFYSVVFAQGVLPLIRAQERFRRRKTLRPAIRLIGSDSRANS
jgi:hypothetical protein